MKDELEIEKYNIDIQSSNSQNKQMLNDFIFLTAAELSLQRGFQYFTQINKVEILSCVFSYSTKTYGKISNAGSYSGDTYLDKNTTCSSLLGGDFMFLNDLSDLKEGVFYKPTDTELKIMPVLQLYYGTTPNIGSKEVNSHNSEKTSDSETYYTKTNVKDAWSTIYDAKGLAIDLRKKYKIRNSAPYSFKERGKKHRQKKDDVLLKNQIKLE